MGWNAKKGVLESFRIDDNLCVYTHNHILQPPPGSAFRGQQFESDTAIIPPVVVPHLLLCLLTKGCRGFYFRLVLGL